jgi:secondary thiamine-phosphate synthase enzyme
MLRRLSVQTRGRGLHEITAEVSDAVTASALRQGICTVFVQHTSCSLLIQENADPSAARDLERWLDRTVPDGEAFYTHVAEGPDDMPSHIKAMLLPTSLSIPVLDAVRAPARGQPAQRRRPRRRLKRACAVRAHVLVSSGPSARPRQCFQVALSWRTPCNASRPW